MARQATIGNLALSQDWSTDAAVTECSTAAAKGPGMLTAGGMARTHHVVDPQMRPALTAFGDLRFLGKVWAPREKLEVLRIQVREVYDEFLSWPGSYNQLLLTGSLDYCRSALTKLRERPIEVQDTLIPQIRDYYAQCYAISKQYPDAKTTVRRLNLQSLKDKFELLQQVCASAHVYSRLEDLDPADIPSE